MPLAPGTAIHGRMRQRIVAISRSRGSHRRIARDRYLRDLVHSGAITSNDLDSAIDACGEALSEFTWLTGVDEAVLRRADCVFLVNHGRFPVENGDFRLNGAYYRICRSLQFDPRYYDSQLELFPLALEVHRKVSRTGDTDVRVDPSAPIAPPVVLAGQPKSPQAPRTKRSAGAGMAMKRGNAWAFAGVLVIGLITTPILATMIVRNFSQVTLATGLSIGGAWLALLVGALALALPRRRG